MKKFNIKPISIMALTISTAFFGGCGNENLKSQNQMEQKIIDEKLSKENQWVNSPLRNRLKLELNASPDKVWTLVGNPSNMPEYSKGLKEVITTWNANGNCTGYICHFKPVQGEVEGMTHHATIKWHEKNRGWASQDQDDNPFGMIQSLSLMTLEPHNGNTIFIWQFHFNCENEEMLNSNKDGYKIALDDIAQQLIQRFGGVQLENYVEEI